MKKMFIKEGRRQMKKAFIIILVATLFLNILTGCGFVQKAPEDTNTKSLIDETAAEPAYYVIPYASESISGPRPEPKEQTNKNSQPVPEVPEEPSAKEMWQDLRSYAAKYLDGSWGGSPIMREDYREGKEPYAYMTPDGWLHVGDVPEVIPGVTTETSFQQLEKSFFNGEWKKTRYGENWFIWSKDYTRLYEINHYSGSVSLRKYADDVKGQSCIEYEDHIGFIARQSIEDLNLDEIVQMYRDGTWDGSLLLAGADNTVLYDNCVGLEIYSASKSEWNVTGIFPAIGNSPILESFAAYTDQYTERTLAIIVDESKAILVERNGELVATYDVADGHEREALIVPGVSDPDFGYPTIFYNGETLYAFDFETATLTPMYSGVLTMSYWIESLEFAYQNGDQLFVVERVGGEFREYEVQPMDYVISGDGQVSFYIEKEGGMLVDIETYIRYVN